MSKFNRHAFLITFTVWVSAISGYLVGLHYGEINGVKLAHEERDAQLSENDKQMQRIGACRYARSILKDNSFCAKGGE